jgi:hypothetical protein
MDSCSNIGVLFLLFLAGDFFITEVREIYIIYPLSVLEIVDGWVVVGMGDFDEGDWCLYLI